MDMNDLVRTKNGMIKGIRLEGRYEGVTEFRRVPYAMPPVGDLRWKPPVEAEDWEGVLDCTEHACIPMQIHSKESVGLPMSEDCLYLVIDTVSDNPEDKMPVFVWFHGGALENGSAYSHDSSKAALAKKGIVVVSVEQRLNMFGYMALPQLSKEQGGKSGNYGLMDQIMVFKWIRENISSFGGDPDHITVGGQSGGTDKLAALVAVPKLRGQIKGMICESGLKWAQTYTNLEKKEKSCAQALESIGYDPSLPIDELRKIDAFELIEKEKDRKKNSKLEAHLPHTTHGEMICDGELVVAGNTKDILDMSMKNVNVLCGTNLGEAKVMNAGLTKAQMKQTKQLNVKTAEEFYSFYRNLLGPLYEKYDFENLVRVSDEDANYTMRKLASLGLTPPIGNNSSRSVMIGRVFAEHIEKLYPEDKVYTYLFEMAPKAKAEYSNWAQMGVSGNSVSGEEKEDERFSWHCCEMDYVYDCLDLKRHMFEYDEEDQKAADYMCEYWANFIKTGNPNGEGLEYWPESAKEKGYIVLGKKAEGICGTGKLDDLIHEFVTEYFPV